MAPPREPGEMRWPSRLVVAGVLGLVAIAGLALTGYLTGSETLQRISPQLPAIRVASALGLLALAAGIWLLRLPEALPRRLGSALGAAITVLGGLIAVGNLDTSGPIAVQLFASGGEQSGLPAPGTAAGFILTGLCLTLLDADPPRYRPASILVPLTALLSFGTLVGYAYEVEYLRGGGDTAGVALHTAISFVLASLALTCLRPERGLVAALRGDDEVDATGRRLIALAILSPVLLGLATLAGVDAGLYDSRVGFSLVTVLTILVLIGLSLTYLHQVRLADLGRRRAAAVLARSERSFRAVTESAIEAVFIADEQGEIVWVNPAGERMFGWSAEELEARPLTMLMPERFREKHRSGIRRYLEEGTKVVIGRTVELAGLRRDGSEFPLALSLSDWQVDGRTYFTGMVSDISERVRVEEANKLLADIVDASEDAILGKDLEGTIQTWNGGAQRIYGYSAAEVVGRNIRMLVPEERLAEIDTIMGRVRSGEVISDFDTERVRKDGKRVTVSLTISPMRDIEGAIVGASTISRDVTRRRLAQQAIEAERARLAEAQAIARVGSYEMDPRTGEMEWSRQMFVNYGLDPEGPTPRSYDVIERIHPEDRERVLERLVRLRESARPFDDEYRVVKPDGEVVTIEVKARLIEAADGSARISGTTRDVTAERDADRAKDEFFGLISHELRTPLTSIIGYTELISDFGGEGMDEQLARWIDVIDRNARRQLRLVQDLLMLARLEAHRFEITDDDFDLVPIAAGFVEEARAAAEAGGVSIELRSSGPLHVRGDAHRLGQVVENLLSNAIKFSPSGGEVVIELREDERGAVLAVSDNGIGIPADEIEHVFERLFRASTAAQMHVQGTGLGLTIAKAIVEEHGGEISAWSRAGSGTRFEVILPRRPDLGSPAGGIQGDGRRSAALEDVRGD